MTNRPEKTTAKPLRAEVTHSDAGWPMPFGTDSVPTEHGIPAHTSA